MSLEVTLRPKIPMPYYTCIPHVVALGICDACPDVSIWWPYGICNAKYGRCLEIGARAGYDEEGTFCTVTLDGALELTDEMLDTVVRRVDAWEKAVRENPRRAPLTSVLSDYADAQALLGERVVVCYPNGSVVFGGTFLGIDVWGRATVRTEDGRDVEFGPERYQLLPPSC
jgi:BirA family biotin operon repressor/biotin-[acetyl-CoA-carboxylase] ligase